MSAFNFNAVLGRGVVELGLDPREFQAGVASANRTAAGFATTLTRTFSLARSLAAGAGVAGVFYAPIRAAAQQELAEKKLTAALKARGVESNAVLTSLKDQASEIQKATRYSSDFIMDLETQALNLGASADAAGELAKATIGLSTALGRNASPELLKYISLAQQGEFTMLQRYIPAIAKANTQSDKMAVVLKVINDGLKQEAAAAGTAAGKWEQLKNSSSDVLGVFGKLIEPGTHAGLDLLKSWVEAFNNLADAITKAAEAGEKKGGDGLNFWQRLTIPGQIAAQVLSNAAQNAPTIVSSFAHQVSQPSGDMIAAVRRSLATGRLDPSLLLATNDLGREAADYVGMYLRGEIPRSSLQVYLRQAGFINNDPEPVTSKSISGAEEISQEDLDALAALGNFRVGRLGVRPDVESRLLGFGSGSSGAARGSIGGIEEAFASFQAKLLTPQEKADQEIIRKMEEWLQRQEKQQRTLEEIEKLNREIARKNPGLLQ